MYPCSSITGTEHSRHIAELTTRCTHAHLWDSSLYAETPVPTGKRLLPSFVYRQCTMAHRCDYGWVSNFYLSTTTICSSIGDSIHERSAREKISSDQVAHVLNDEVSRKYIQSLKRWGSRHLHFPASFNFLRSWVFLQYIDLYANEISARGCHATYGMIGYAWTNFLVLYAYECTISFFHPELLHFGINNQALREGTYYASDYHPSSSLTV